MVEFKVGDKVRVLSGGGRWRSPGTEGVVSRLIGSTYRDYNVLFTTPDEDGDLDLSFDGSELELVTETEEDVVNHPKHYTAFGAEVIDITEHLNFCRGNAVKYIARAGLKDPDKELEDLEKGLWYLNREIARVKRMKEAAK